MDISLVYTQNNERKNKRIAVNYGETVLELKIRIAHSTSIPLNKMRFMSCGKKLENNEIIELGKHKDVSFFHIFSNDTINEINLNDLSGINKLAYYIYDRMKDNRSVFGFFDVFFGGHTKETKLSAANKLLAFSKGSSMGNLSLTPLEFKALNQGRLKEIFKQANLSDEQIIIEAPSFTPR